MSILQKKPKNNAFRVDTNNAIRDIVSNNHGDVAMPLAIRRIQSCPEKVVELAEQIVLDLHRQGFWLSAARGLTFVPSDAVELIHELELSPEDCTEYNEAVAAFWHQPAHLDHGELKLSAAAKLHTLMDKAVELMASQLAARELEAEKEP